MTPAGLTVTAAPVIISPTDHSRRKFVSHHQQQTTTSLSSAEFQLPSARLPSQYYTPDKPRNKSHNNRLPLVACSNLRSNFASASVSTLYNNNNVQLRPHAQLLRDIVPSLSAQSSEITPLQDSRRRRSAALIETTTAQQQLNVRKPPSFNLFTPQRRGTGASQQLPSGFSSERTAPPKNEWARSRLPSSSSFHSGIYDNVHDDDEFCIDSGQKADFTKSPTKKRYLPYNNNNKSPAAMYNKSTGNCESVLTASLNQNRDSACLKYGSRPHARIVSSVAEASNPASSAPISHDKLNRYNDGKTSKAIASRVSETQATQKSVHPLHSVRRQTATQADSPHRLLADLTTDESTDEPSSVVRLKHRSKSVGRHTAAAQYMHPDDDFYAKIIDKNMQTHPDGVKNLPASCRKVASVLPLSAHNHHYDHVDSVIPEQQKSYVGKQQHNQHAARFAEFLSNKSPTYYNACTANNIAPVAAPNQQKLNFMPQTSSSSLMFSATHSLSQSVSVNSFVQHDNNQSGSKPSQNKLNSHHNNNHRENNKTGNNIADSDNEHASDERHVRNSELPRYGRLCSENFTSRTQKQKDMERKRLYRVGLNLFNTDVDLGLKFLNQNGFVGSSHRQVARFLYARKGLSKHVIGEYLSRNPKDDKHNGAFAHEVLKHFLHELDFSGLDAAQALRRFISCINLSGEAQRIDRLIDAFASHFYNNSPPNQRAFNSVLSLQCFSFALIMLNTDLHHPRFAQRGGGGGNARAMKFDEFVTNLKQALPDKDTLDIAYLRRAYENIRTTKLEMGDDHVSQVRQLESRIVIGNNGGSGVGLVASASSSHAFGLNCNSSVIKLATNRRRLVCFCRLYCQALISSAHAACSNDNCSMCVEQAVANIKHTSDDGAIESKKKSTFSALQFTRRRARSKSASAFVKTRSVSLSSKRTKDQNICAADAAALKKKSRIELGRAQREVFLFNDLLLITQQQQERSSTVITTKQQKKLSKQQAVANSLDEKQQTSPTASAMDETFCQWYELKACIDLHSLRDVELFQSPSEPYGVRLITDTGVPVLIFGARNASDRDNFSTDLIESIAEAALTSQVLEQFEQLAAKKRQNGLADIVVANGDVKGITNFAAAASVAVNSKKSSMPLAASETSNTETISTTSSMSSASLSSSNLVNTSISSSSTSSSSSSSVPRSASNASANTSNSTNNKFTTASVGTVDDCQQSNVSKITSNGGSSKMNILKSKYFGNFSSHQSSLASSAIEQHRPSVSSSSATNNCSHSSSSLSGVSNNNNKNLALLQTENRDSGYAEEP